MGAFQSVRADVLTRSLLQGMRERLGALRRACVSRGSHGAHMAEDTPPLSRHQGAPMTHANREVCLLCVAVGLVVGTGVTFVGALLVIGGFR